MRALILTLLFLPVRGFSVEPAHYTVRQDSQRIGPMSYPVDMYVGNYGEVLRYSEAFTLMPPTLDHGIEAVRLYYSKLRSLDKLIPKFADFTPENFFKLDLAEILVIPQNNGGYQDLDALREEKIKYLKAHGVVFRIDQDIQLDHDPWPPKSFMVYVSSPTEMTQLYAARNGLLYIATVGRDISKETPSIDSYELGQDYATRAAMSHLISEIGSYFVHLAAIDEARKSAKTAQFDFFGWEKACLPLAILGFIFSILPWGKRFFHPLAAGAWSACALGMAFSAFGFYFARQLMNWDATGGFNSTWVWCALQTPFLLITYLLSRKLGPAHRWTILTLCLFISAGLSTFGPWGAKEVVSGAEPLTRILEYYMMLIGLLHGFCFGLLVDLPSWRNSNTLAFLILILATPVLRAQDTRAPKSPDVRIEAERRLA